MEQMRAEAWLDAQLLRKRSPGIPWHWMLLRRISSAQTRTETKKSEPELDGGSSSYFIISLRRRSEISAPRPYTEILAVEGYDLNAAKVAVSFEIGRFVGNRILAAQLILYLGKRVRYVSDLERKERPPAGRVGNSLQHFISGPFGSAYVRADRVYDGVGALRHFDGFFAGYVALVILAVAQQNDRAPCGAILRLLQQLVAAGVVESIIHRRSASGAEFAHAMRQFFRVVGEILSDLRRHIETNHHGLIVATANDLVQELNGRLLLELKPVAHRVAGVDEQSDLQWQIRLGTKAANFSWRLIVVGDAEVVLLEIGDVFSVLIRNRENHIHFIDANADAGNVIGAGSVIARFGVSRIFCLGLLRRNIWKA